MPETSVTITKHVPQPLSHDRQRELGNELALTINDRERLKEHLKEYSSKTKDLIEQRESKIKELALAVGQGFEMLPVACYVEYEMDTNITRIRKVHDHSILEERAMTPEERRRLIDERDETHAEKGNSRKNNKRV